LADRREFLKIGAAAVGGAVIASIVEIPYSANTASQKDQQISSLQSQISNAISTTSSKASSSIQQFTPTEIAQIGTTLGITPDVHADEGVVKANFPRTDIKVTVDDWGMVPFIGLTAYGSFQKVGSTGQVMVMGDMVLFEDEVNPTMSTAFANGLDVTALHNHFFFDNPKIYFMHIYGMGELGAITSAVKATVDSKVSIRATNAQPQQQFGGPTIPSTSSIDGSGIDKIFGVTGQANTGMYKVVVGRQATMTDCGCTVGKTMGVNTFAAFAGTNDNALVYGDFAVLESELQSVLRTLRQGGINIASIHSHMTNEQPKIMFLHYWGKGSTTDLSTALKNALNKTSSV
jgi:Domain of Unknown Function (DUF1259)